MEIGNNNQKDYKENILSLLWAKYFPFWPVFLCLIVFAISGAWVYLQFKLPVYESTATLIINDEKKGTEDSKISESLNVLASKKIIENEIDVIKSRTLLHQVVEQLKLYAPVYEERKWKNLSLYTNSPIKIEVQSPDSLVEINKVPFNYNANKKEVTINGQNFQLNQWLATPWGILRFSATNVAYFSKAPTYFALVNPKRVVQNLAKSLDVSPSNKLSTVVNLSLKDEEPKRSEDILNTLIADYEKTSINDKNALAQNTLAFLDERLAIVTNDLATIEKQLQKYKANNGAIDISSQGQNYLHNVSDNDQKLSEVNMKIAVLKQVEQYVSSKNTHGVVVPSTLGVNDPMLSSLLENLYETELQYEKLKSTTGENNPALASLADQLEKIRPSILENINSQQRGLEANKLNLSYTNSSYATSLQALPQRERDLVQISREQSIKSAIYSYLLQKREETALSHSSISSDSKVVNRAESSLDPVGYNKNLVYAISIIIALGLGIIMITANELFRHTILFRQEIEDATRFPVIGEIAQEKSGSPLAIEYGKTGFIAEEFRLLRTSLHSLGIEKDKNRILITSTISGDGKSFVAINLAMSLALGGKKVILVECDLNNPTVAIKLGIDAKKGVADYLKGEVSADEVIMSTENNDNLYIMTAGNLPENPSELILSEKTEKLLAYLKNIFDYVIVDSAPVGILSDGYVLSRFCDATLYIVRHKHTPKKMLQRLEANNKINELKNLAIVFNGVEARGFGGKGYGYGYMYSENQKIKKRVYNI